MSRVGRVGGARRAALAAVVVQGSIALAVAVLGAAPARAAGGQPLAETLDPKDAGLKAKLTAGVYSGADGSTGIDLNLRAGDGPHTAWIGFYRDDAGARQARGGYEHHADWAWARTVLSAQVAGGGFLGGSASAELGGATYALVGFGRTNVRDYINLNFDPNDAITLGAGTRALAHTELLAFQVRDDRLHTGQRVTHAVLRRSDGDARRLTLDLSAKRGLTTDGNFISARAWTLTWDHDRVFVRFARDPYAGFGPVGQSRLSFGARF